jgi:hypothetical protein
VSEASFAERMRKDPELVSGHLEILGRLHPHIHAHSVPYFGGLKVRLSTRIARTNSIEGSHRRSLLRGLADMSDGDRLCHGDFHPMKLAGEATRPIVIDWPDACRGDPAADVCRSYLLMKLQAEDLAEPYFDAYCRLSDMPRQAILGWLPYVAAARLAEHIADEVDDLLIILRSP